MARTWDMDSDSLDMQPFVFRLKLAVQQELFPHIEAIIGPLSEKEKKFAMVAELLPLDNLMQCYRWSGFGRPPHLRTRMLLAFIAKAVWNIPTTKDMIDRLKGDSRLRRLCAWPDTDKLPSESSFSRAFATFAADALPTKVHEALVSVGLSEKLVGHISRDSTAIEARETPAKRINKRASRRSRGANSDCTITRAVRATMKAGIKASRKGSRGQAKSTSRRPTPKEEKRLTLQAGRTLEENLQDLPTQCDVGVKRNSEGYTNRWIGYKLHIDTADGDIPVSAILTSASLHDSQVAIPLMQKTSQLLDYLYDLGDSAFDAKAIREYSRKLGHVPIIDVNKRRGSAVGFDPAEQTRYQERVGSERVNSNLKDNYGGRFVRVRGPAKVLAHLMMGIIAMTGIHILRMLE